MWHTRRDDAFLGKTFKKALAVVPTLHVSTLIEKWIASSCVEGLSLLSTVRNRREILKLEPVCFLDAE